MQFFNHLKEFRDLAFLKWQQSRYTDFDAHDKYIHWYEQVQKFNQYSKYS
jgi:hypothetical protein